MKQNSSVKILHISDVHFGMHDFDGNQQRVAYAVLDSLKKYNQAIDCVVFSGDLSQSGKHSEFQQGLEWLSEICSTLNCPCIIVPGNHDINRDIAKQIILRAAHHSKDEFGNCLKEIYKDHPHVTPFLEWHKASREESQFLINSWGKTPSLDKVNIQLNNISCVFICLNTALLSCDNKDETRLCIDQKALNGALDFSTTSNNLVIAVGHHPISYMADWNKEAINETFGQHTGPHAYLHGHLHRENNEATYSSNGSGIFTGAAGAIYSGQDYKRQFAIIEFDLSAKLIKPEVYVFNKPSGVWIIDNALSNPLPARLPDPESVYANTGRDVDDQIAAQQEIINPFMEYAANGISAEDVHQLFVERRHSLRSLLVSHDTIVEGQRGTGKTMLLRYFSIEVQRSIIEAQNKIETSAQIIEILNKNNLPFGVYCCLTHAGLDRSDFLAITNDARSRQLFSHLASLLIITRILSSIRDGALIANVNTNRLTKRIRSKFLQMLRIDMPELISDFDFIDGALLRTSTLREQTYEHLNSCLPGAQQTTFNPWLTLPSAVIDTIEIIKSEFLLSTPFFLLIDDFDKLNGAQQSIFFTVASARKRDLVCFKFGCLSEGIQANVTTDGRRYSEGDDYDHIPLDWVDGGIEPAKNLDYKGSLDDITKRRLQRAKWPEGVTFDNLFEVWGSGNQLRSESKLLALEEFNNNKQKQSSQTFESYWNKQGTALYFRFLYKKKIPHRYAGPQAIVEVSSGIYRQFLEVCGRIVSAALAQRWRPGKRKIGPEIQNKCIREWSSGMFKNLESSGNTTNLTSATVAVTSENLIILANSLTLYFRARLMSASRDPEVIAIAIRDPILPGTFTKTLLDVAVRETLLQRRASDYSSKAGDGKRLPTFQLNRRLIPHVGIGSKLQGRIEIDTKMLELAATNTEAFLQSMLPQTPKQDTLDLI